MKYITTKHVPSKKCGRSLRIHARVEHDASQIISHEIIRNSEMKKFQRLNSYLLPTRTRDPRNPIEIGNRRLIGRWHKSPRYTATIPKGFAPYGVYEMHSREVISLEEA